MVCKICNLEKVKEPVTRKDSTRFVDHNGKLWNGKVCPDCYKVYNKERMRKKRSEKIKELDI